MSRKETEPRPNKGVHVLLEKMKSILKYPGAKNRIASWIIDYMPKHDIYLESFAGSLAVFLTNQDAGLKQ